MTIIHDRFIHLLSPMHVGGNFEFSVVDQPIQREGHTGFPKIEASSFKGSVRHYYERVTSEEAEESQLFGSTEQAGKLTFTDASILFFPIRSAKGVYALITCPTLLKRYSASSNISIEDNQASVTSKKLCIDNNVLLDEYLYENVKEDSDFKELVSEIQGYMPEVELTDRALLLSDDDFAYFVKNHTEIITRTAIDSEKGIVTEGALFSEEYVPMEAIFYVQIYGETKYIELLDLDVLQIGGNMTLGKGFVKIYKGGDI